MKKLTCCLTTMVLASGTAFADFSFTETTRMTGGALMNMTRSLGAFSKSMRKIGEPISSTVSLKGNRLATVHETNADIIDLDEETMTHIDFENKIYSTITFAQMKEAMEKGMQRMKEEMAKAEQKSKTDPKRQPSDPQMEMNMKMDVKDTGKKQIINGLQTHEMILLTTMEAKEKKSGNAGEIQTVMSIWLTDSVPGHQELEDFYKRMAVKMAANMQNTIFSQQAMQMGADPRFRASMENLSKEAGKLKGIQVRTVTKMGSNVDLDTAGQVTDPSTQPQGPSAGQVAGSAAQTESQNQALGRLGGRLGIPGGLGGLGRGRKSKDEQSSQAPASQSQQQAGQNAVLMEMLMEKGNFSTAAVDASKFAVPAGFRQVEHPSMKALNK